MPRPPTDPRVMHFLPDPCRFSEPFRYVVDAAAVPAELCADLRALFDLDLDWELHQTFYEAWLADVSEHVPAVVSSGLADRARQLTGLPLSNGVRVTIQRMEPGQFAGVHSDRPQAGFEAARLVLQLNDDWLPGDGGVLEVHAHEASSSAVRSHEPRYGSGFLFSLHRASLHAVTPVARTRRTVVFNLFHVGNPTGLAASVHTLFGGMHVRALPQALEALAVESEARLGELDTYRAACVAWVLSRTQADSGLVRAGYLAGLRPLSCEELSESGANPHIALARWATHLRLDDFDHHLWCAVAAVVAQSTATEAVRSLAAELAVSGRGTDVTSQGPPRPLR